MQTRLTLSLAAALTLLAPLALAESPLTGAWKPNLQKSNLTGDTITFAAGDPGMVKITSGGMSYSFKPDGTEVKTPLGATASWTRVDDTTWKETEKLGTTPLSTNTYKLADDGKSFTANYVGTKPNGEKFNDTATYARVLPGKGFLGKWKSTKVDVSMAGYVIKENPDGTLLWSLPDFKATVTLETDGKDYPAVGPTVPPGLTLSLMPESTHKFVLVQKMNGKAFFKGTETISADGKTLTEYGSNVGVVEPSTVVYDKQ